jgi:tRNA threonylcarbamoyladenosine biosynthesis protein TsaE
LTADGYCLHYDCSSPVATRRLARLLGRLARPGLVIALTGALGSGKTAFVQGLAQGLAVPPDCYVTSPSFTLINVYPGRIPLCHADLYRLGEGADLEAIGLLDHLEQEEVVAVEWAAHAAADLPLDHLTVHLEISGDRQRRITLTAGGRETENLLKDVAAAWRQDPFSG